MQVKHENIVGIIGLLKDGRKPCKVILPWVPWTLYSFSLGAMNKPLSQCFSHLVSDFFPFAYLFIFQDGIISLLGNGYLDWPRVPA